MEFRQKLVSILFSLVLVVCVQPVSAQEDSLENRIDGILSDWDIYGNPGAAVAYIEGGEVIFQKAYGLANLEHEIPWTAVTVSDLGSVSKQFTGFAFAMLAEQERLTLDDDIRLYLPQLPDFGETITIRHLFNHTSGLREIYNTLYMINRKPGDIIFQEDAQTLVKYQSGLQFSPGSRYLYNNTEYMLLADILEAVTGQEFHAWMQENIFDPLQMHDTYVMHRQGQVIPRVATSYVRDGEGHFTQRYDNSTLQGAGGIYSTVEDMTKWIANLSSNKIGSPNVISNMTRSGSLNSGALLGYGLGINISISGGALQWSHGGSSAGYRSMLMYLPVVERGFIYMTNTPSLGSPVPELTEAFLGDVMNIPAREEGMEAEEDTPAIHLPDPGVYTGRYLSDELEAFYNIELEGDQLILSHRWLGSYEMSYLGNNQFDVERFGGPVTFVRNSNNEIEKFILDNGRTIGVEFRRID